MMEKDIINMPTNNIVLLTGQAIQQENTLKSLKALIGTLFQLRSKQFFVVKKVFVPRPLLELVYPKLRLGFQFEVKVEVQALLVLVCCS